MQNFFYVTNLYKFSSLDIHNLFIHSKPPSSMVTVTAITAVEYCARKFWLQRILKLVEFPKEAMIKGSIRHDALEHLNYKEEEIVKKATKENIIQLYNDEIARTLIAAIKKHNKINLDSTELFTQSMKILTKVTDQRANNVLSFMNRTNFTGEQLWFELTPKIKSEITLVSSSLDLYGRIDEIREYRDFSIPVELKTGKCPTDGPWPAHKLQIGAYMMMLREKTITNYGVIHYIDHNKIFKVHLNPFLEENILKMREKVVETLNSKQVPEKTPHINKCKSCDLREQCYDEEFLRSKNALIG